MKQILYDMGDFLGLQPHFMDLKNEDECVLKVSGPKNVF